MNWKKFKNKNKLFVKNAFPHFTLNLKYFTSVRYLSSWIQSTHTFVSYCTRLSQIDSVEWIINVSVFVVCSVHSNHRIRWIFHQKSWIYLFLVTLHFFYSKIEFATWVIISTFSCCRAGNSKIFDDIVSSIWHALCNVYQNEI